MERMTSLDEGFEEVGEEGVLGVEDMGVEGMRVLASRRKGNVARRSCMSANATSLQYFGRDPNLPR